MSGFTFFAAVFCAAASAVNFVVYAADGAVWNLGCGIFCAFLVLVNLVSGAKS